MEPRDRDRDWSISRNVNCVDRCAAIRFLQTRFQDIWCSAQDRATLIVDVIAGRAIALISHQEYNLIAQGAANGYNYIERAAGWMKIIRLGRRLQNDWLGCGVLWQDCGDRPSHDFAGMDLASFSRCGQQSVGKKSGNTHMFKLILPTNTLRLETHRVLFMYKDTHEIIVIRNNAKLTWKTLLSLCLRPRHNSPQRVAIRSEFLFCGMGISQVRGTLMT